MAIDLAVDLGTKNIVIMHNDKVLIDDEAIVALRFDKDAPVLWLYLAIILTIILIICL